MNLSSSLNEVSNYSIENFFEFIENEIGIRHSKRKKDFVKNIVRISILFNLSGAGLGKVYYQKMCQGNIFIYRFRKC